jgi:hypothetical protein
LHRDWIFAFDMCRQASFVLFGGFDRVPPS